MINLTKLIGTNMIKDLLNNLETRNTIKQAVEQAISIKHSQEQCKDDLKEITEGMKDKYDIKPSEFNQFVQAAFDTEKFQDTYNKVKSTSESLDILYS